MSESCNLYFDGMCYSTYNRAKYSRKPKKCVEKDCPWNRGSYGMSVGEQRLRFIVKGSDRKIGVDRSAKECFKEMCNWSEEDWNRKMEVDDPLEREE